MINEICGVTESGIEVGVDHVRGHGLQVHCEAFQPIEPFSQRARPAVVVRQTTDVVLQSMKTRRSEHASLPHPSTEHLAKAMCSINE